MGTDPDPFWWGCRGSRAARLESLRYRIAQLVPCLNRCLVLLCGSEGLRCSPPLRLTLPGVCPSCLILKSTAFEVPLQCSSAGARRLLAPSAGSSELHAAA